MYIRQEGRILFLIIAAFIILVSMSFLTVYASSDGYIVSLNEAPVMFFSEETPAGYIDDTLYKVDTVKEAYEIFGEENIKSCFPDFEMELFDYPETTSDTYFHLQWCHNSIKAETAREKGLTGKGVKIAVIDSGVDKNHSDFEGVTFEQGYNCLEGASDVYDITDNQGHGTMVTGVIAACTDNESGIAGIASDVTIIPIKVTDTPTFSLSMLLKGLKKALETDCDIINMSLGGPVTGSQALAEFKKYTDEAEDRGIIIVAAAGNSGDKDNTLNYPAGFDTVVGVGAVDKNLNVPEFSQKNEGVFMTAPGVSIPTIMKGGGAGSAGGTSFASPIVAASVALVKQVCPEYGGENIRNLLKDTVVDMGNEGYDESYGHGMLNLENMICEIQSRLPDFVVTQGKKDSVCAIHIHNNTSASYKAQLILSGDTVGIEEKQINNGVTNIYDMDGVKSVMLWKSNLTPLIKKYFLK